MGMCTPLALVVGWVGLFTVMRWLLPWRGVTVWTPGMPALIMGSRPGPWPRSRMSVQGVWWRFPPPTWCSPILRMPGSLQMWWRSLGPQEWTTPGLISMFATIVSSWKFRSTLLTHLSFCGTWSRSRLQVFTPQLSLFLNGGGGGSSFIFSFDRMPHLKTHHYYWNCWMKINLQTLALLFAVQVASVWKEVQMVPPQLSLGMICGSFWGWKLQNPMQVVLAPREAQVTCLPFGG